MMSNWVAQLLRLCASPRLRWQLLLGLSEGLPLALITTTLQAWLADQDITTSTIGWLTLVSMPYSLKPLWAPLIDRFSWPFLDRRRGWILVGQLGVLISLWLLAGCDPQHHLGVIAVIAALTGLFGASQDIAIDAYRTDSLLPDERGLASALFMGGWRIGSLLAGGVGLIVAHHLGWWVTYTSFASLMGLGIIATWLSPAITQARTPVTLKSAIIEPLEEFGQRAGALCALLFVVTYKLGNAFALSLMSVFLIKHLNFSVQTVGSVSKIYGTLATLGGMVLGGVLLARVRLYPALLGFGISQLLANMGFMLLAYQGKHYGLLVGAVTIEHLTSGMATAAFLAFLMALCDARYTATQFALLTALDSLGRSYLGPMAGLVAQYWGWLAYFGISLIIGIPGLILLVILWRFYAIGQCRKASVSINSE